MASLLFEEGVQRVSLSPSDSGLDPGDMEPCADSLPIPNSPRSLDLDDGQGLIASSAMQQKKMC